MDERIAVYLQNLATSGKSKNTIDAYKRDLVKLENFLTEERLDLADFEELQIVGYTE